MRTSEASYLSESYVFYEAILTREYFKEGLFQDLNLTNKQLRFFARFISVCLLLNHRHMVHQLVNHLKILLDECKRTLQVIYLNYFCCFNYPSLFLWYYANFNELFSFFSKRGVGGVPYFPYVDET